MPPAVLARNRRRQPEDLRIALSEGPNGNVA
jgi:hypothetical protein